MSEEGTESRILEQAIELAQDVFKRQKKTFFLFLSAVLLVTVVGSLVMTPVYEAGATILVTPQAGKEVDVNPVVGDDRGGGKEMARTQLQIMQSRTVREAVIKRYNALGYDDYGTSQQDLINFGRNMWVGPVEATQLVKIAIQHPDPERAAILANLVAETYCDMNLLSRTDAAKESSVWLDSKSREYRDSVEKGNEDLLRFREDNDVVDIEDAISGIGVQLAALQNARGQTSTERVLLETNLREHEKLYKAEQFEVLAGMYTDPVVSALAQRRAQAISDVAVARIRLGELNPEYLSAAASLERLESDLREAVQRSLESERAQVRVLQNQEANLGSKIDELNKQLLEQQRIRARYDELKMNHDQDLETYRRLSSRETEVDLQAMTRLNNVRIIDRAVPPADPAKPNIPINLVVGLFVGVAGGAGLAFLRYQLDGHIGSKRDVKRILPEDVLGSVPHLPSKVPERLRALYAIDNPLSAAAESMRAVRAVVSKQLGTKGSHKILVTSSSRGEGKTLTACGLAIAYAQQGTRVLLVDGDLRDPSLHTIFSLHPKPGLPEALEDVFGLEGGPGLAEALADPSDPQYYVHFTALPNLFVLPSRPGVEKPHELLASATMRYALNLLGEAFPVIIIDAPPTRLVSDALVLTEHVDGVIVVLRSGTASHKAAMVGVERLRQVSANLLGVVLNDVDEPGNIVPYGAMADKRRRDARTA